MSIFFADFAKSEAFFVYDLKNNDILTAKNEYQKIPPASITKIMTAILTLEAIKNGSIDLYEIHNIRENSLVGQYTIRDLMILSSVLSNNNASAALAKIVGRSMENFVVMMNTKAEEIGLHSTKFANPTGLPDLNQYSNAKDLYVMTRYFAENFREYESLFNIKYAFINSKFLQMRNQFTFGYKCIKSHKTGFTNASQYNIAVHLQCVENYDIVAVLLSAPSNEARDEYLAKIINYSVEKIGKSYNEDRDKKFYLQKEYEYEYSKSFMPIVFNVILLSNMTDKVQTYYFFESLYNDLIADFKNTMKNEMQKISLPEPKSY